MNVKRRLISKEGEPQDNVTIDTGMKAAAGIAFHSDANPILQDEGWASHKVAEASHIIAEGADITEPDGAVVNI